MPVRAVEGCRWCFLAALWALCGSGCGNGGLVAVEGRAFLNDKPISTGSLLFSPDASKGNKSTIEPAGEIDEQGQYKVYTDRKPGAPPGWYKVVVVATEPPDPNNLSAERKSILPLKYNAAATTDLFVEVVAKPAPGAYDLKLKK